MIATTTGWDHRFLSMAKLVSTWSKDPSTQVGAVIVNNHRVAIGLGYNGFPRDVQDLPERYANRELKYDIVVHAEANAILNALGDIRDATIYCTLCPCPNCAGMLIQKGIGRVVYARNEEAEKRWREKMEISMMMFREAGVHVSSI